MCAERMVMDIASSQLVPRLLQVILFAFASYFIADGQNQSGIVSVLFCGMVRSLLQPQVAGWRVCSMVEEPHAAY